MNKETNMDGKLLGAADGKPTDLLKDLVQGIVEKALKSEKVKAIIAEVLNDLLKPAPAVEPAAPVADPVPPATE